MSGKSFFEKNEPLPTRGARERPIFLKISAPPYVGISNNSTEAYKIHSIVAL